MDKTRATERHWQVAALIFLAALFVLSQSAEVFAAGWVQRYSEPGKGMDNPRAVAIDASGNIYVTGSTTGFLPTSSSIMTTIKYNKSGKQIWARYYTIEQILVPAYTTGANAIALDSAGNVYVAGYMGSTTKNEYFFLIVKYDADGQDVGGAGYSTPDKGFQSATGIALDSEGSFYVTGVVPGAGGTTMTDYMTVKFNADGDQQWAKPYNGPGNGADYPTAIAVDQYNSRIYVTGYSQGLTSGNDYATLQYDALGNQKWVRRYNGPGNLSDQANALAIDGSGNIYVTGQSVGTNSSYDYATIKYDINGALIGGVKRYNGPGNNYDVATAIGVDNNNNVYVTGYSFGSGTLYDFATIKYDAAGNQSWVSRYNGSANGYDLATALAVDKSDGSVYVTGSSRVTPTDFDYITVKYGTNGTQSWVKSYSNAGGSDDSPVAMALDSSDGSVCVTGKSKGAATGYDIATVKYAKAGAELWKKRFNMPNGPNRSAAMAVDGAGNVYVTGQSFHSKSSMDWLTAKYDTTGALLWTKRGSGPGYVADAPTAIALDSDGNVYLAGTWGGFGTLSDYGTAKYDTNGTLVWSKRYNGPASHMDTATAIAVDSQKNVYVTGASVGTNNNYDFATVKYSSAGAPGWVRRYNGAANMNDYAAAIAVDSDGNVYITGESEISDAISRYVTIKYDPNGLKLWEAQYDGPISPASGHHYPIGIAVDSAKNVYVTGASQDGANGYDYATIKYDINGVEKWVKRYNGLDKLDDIPAALALDSAKNLYVTGKSTTPSYNSVFATVKYDTNGAPKWVKRLGGPAKGTNYAVAIALDSAKNVYVTGRSWGTATTKGDYLTVMYDTNGVPQWTKRYDGAVGGYDTPVAIGVDSAKNVYVTGSSRGVDGFDEYATIKYPAQ
ncbi:MAG: SBBP repeat-containing protein [Syntrophobacteraceae bacterium]